MSIPWGQNCQTQVIKRNETIAKAINAIFRPQDFLIYPMLPAYQQKTVEAYQSGRDVFVSVSTGAAERPDFELHSFFYVRIIFYKCKLNANT